MARLDQIYREEHGRVLSSVLARVRNFPLAEEVVQDAFVAAAEQWQAAYPPNPRAWLIRVALNKATDQQRRQTRFPEVGEEPLMDIAVEQVPEHDSEVRDERLRLMFTCCHPAIAPEAQVALTLRTIAGLATEDIARLFVMETEALAQRLVRTQRKIRDAAIPYNIPSGPALAERLTAVLATIYLVFTEGYAPSVGDELVRAELCDEAIRLGHLLVELLPDEGECKALLALMLLHDSRRAARMESGEFVRLEEQNRAQWNQKQISKGLTLLDAALAAKANGVYTIQAAIAGLHARVDFAKDTDWPQILSLYDMLRKLQPTPTVELNRAAALAMAVSLQAGLKALDGLKFKLAENHLYHAARADILARLGQKNDASRSYRAALRLVTHPVERRFLERQLANIIK